MNEIASPRVTSLRSIGLCLPFGLLFLLAVLNIGPFQPNATSRVGSADPIEWLMLGLLALIPLAFAINLWQIILHRRSGANLTELSLNIVVGAVILAAILSVAGGVVIDQYPCWTGVPNCD